MKNEVKQFEDDGFLVLRDFYSGEEMDRVSTLITKRKFERPWNIVVDLLDTNERTSLGLLSTDEVRDRRMKINDLYLDMPEVRALALSEKLVSILKALFGYVPVLCNSLYLEKGSAQPPHVDAIYMTPRSDDHLIASWIALEDSDPDAGQLEYFPGSHRLTQMIFSNGSRHAVPEEMSQWEHYMADQVKKAGLKKKFFSAKKGDVIIWHSNLLHGGGRINNGNLTRKSLVYHYFSYIDSQELNFKLVPLNSGFWIDREPQPLPESVLGMIPFNEQAYLARYPDVAQAVKDGAYASGREHYEMFGKKENRYAI